uniref:Uncharacterized protein n=2 Tax=Anopheles arabiensis TaxID=7173 RepID=A0A182I7C1_ANOAR
MAIKIGLLCLLSVVAARGALGQCGEEWYGRDPDLEYPSVEEQRSSRSYEEPSEEYYTVKQQRSLRASRYTPAVYRYANDFRQDGEVSDWERYGAGRKSHYDVHKARSRKSYDSYGKSSRSDYTLKGAPVGKLYERKKTSRAAKYGGEGSAGPSYGKTTSLTYKAVAPKASCAQNLLIGCTPTVTRVPCSASSPYDGHASGGVPYYPPAPVYQPAPSAHHYGMPHPAPYGGYGPPPSSHYYPSPAASHGAPMHQQKEHSEYPTHHAKPSEDAHGYGPSYKAATPEDIPGFAAPVQEPLSESPKVPIISAFAKPSDPPTAGMPPVSSTQPSINGTAAPAAAGVEGETTSPKTPVGPALTPAPAVPQEENEEFWGSNAESSTDVAEGSTARTVVSHYAQYQPPTNRMNSFIAITLLAVIGVAIAAPAKYGGGHAHHGGVVPGPAVVHTYPAVAPVVKCGHNLLVSCDPHHHPVPCKAAPAHHAGYGHHAPAPAPAYHHAPAPHYAPAAPAYHGAEEHGEYRAKHHKKHHKKHHGKGKSADNVGEAIDSSSEAM